MKEELLAEITELTELAKNGVIQVAVMVKEQLPDLVQQILTFKLTISIIGVGVSILILIFGTIIVRKIFRWEVEDADDVIVSPLLAFFGGLLTCVWLCFSTVTMLKILLAPKLYLIELVKELL